MWMKVKDYAALRGVSVVAVHGKIKRGKLKSKHDGKRVWVWCDDGASSDVPVDVDEQSSASSAITEEAIDQANVARARRWDAETEYKLSKIENIRADIVLKKHKSREYRERLRTEYTEGVLEVYTDAFADLKGVVVDLKMKKDQVRKYKDVYMRCMKKFERGLAEYLRKKDDEEEKETELKDEEDKP